MNKSFEDQWKDALSDASRTPPPEIWERVEAELNRKKSRFILWKNPVRGNPVWRNPLLLSGAAAAVTLVLGTLFFVNYSAHERAVSQKTGNPAVTLQEPEAEKPAQAVTSAAPVIAGNTRPFRRQAVAAQQFTTAQAQQVSLPGELPDPTREGSVSENTVRLTYSPLEPLPFRELQGYPGPLRVERPVEYASVSRKAPKEKKGWVGVIASNAPFNPNFSTPGFQQQALAAVQNSNALLSFDKSSLKPGGDSFYSNSSRTDARSSFKQGQAMSVGLMVGRKLKKRLSLESGVRFTRATATHTSNVYALNTLTGETESFSHANYISTEKGQSEVLISVNGTSHYSYHFLAVPLLLNYEVLNIGKLNVNAVGGISSEFLLSGTVVNSKQDEQRFNTGNSNFRPVSIAGMGGLRLSYPVTSALDINLGGTYQHFITSGLQKHTDATFRPSMLGINLGLSVRQ